jgi:hypothetical protein
MAERRILNRRFGRLVAFRASLVIGFTTLSVQATQPDPARAQQLFDEGRTLLIAGRFDEACPKFAESFELDPGGGTILNLAICHEKQGKTGTAWHEFRSALERAQRDGRTDRQRTASERLAELESTVPRLVFNLTNDAQLVEGFALSVDGTTQRIVAFPATIVVDPGVHEIVVSAPGRQSYRTSVSAAPSQSTPVTLPALLSDESKEPSKSSPEVKTGERPKAAPKLLASPQRESRGSLNPGYVVGGVGVALLVAGGYFGVRALNEKSSADDAGCDDRTCPNQEAKEHFDSARTNAHFSTAGIGLGLAALGVGAYLVLSERPTSGKTAVLSVSPVHSGGLISWRTTY